MQSQYDNKPEKKLHNKRRIFSVWQLALAFCLGILLHWSLTDSVKHKPADTEQPQIQHETNKPAFWTCSMHPNIQKREPGKCPICGMDLIPVTTASAKENKETENIRTLTISQTARKLMNIQTTPVEKRYVTAKIRMVGKVDYDETRIRYITARISGRLDHLYVDYTGVSVTEGDHMVYIYSPELYSTQDELIQVLKHAQRQKGKNTIFPDVSNLIKPVRERLRLWGMTKEQIQEIEKSEKPSDHLTIYSPMSGIVIQKNRQEGDYVKTGDRIYTVADLSHLWVMLDAYETDLVWLRYGQEITFTTDAYPGEKFDGRIAFIEPVLNEKTRTVKVRVNVHNHQGKLKPEMFVHGIVQTQISTGGKVIDPYMAGKWICPMHPEIVKDSSGKCDNCGMPLVQAETLGYVTSDIVEGEKPLVIPVTAALITGTRAIVYVEIPEASQPTFEGREIVLGPRAGEYYLVQSGLKEGELVVTNGNFKIDSAVQIQAKPSMMTPDGGSVAGSSHQHGHANMAAETQHTKTLPSTGIPAEFHSRIQELEAIYESISKAIKEQQDIITIRNTFQEFKDTLNKISGKDLSGQLRLQWKEHSMLLNNDAVEGRNAKRHSEVNRILKLMGKHMHNMRNRLGISKDTRQRPHTTHKQKAPAIFKTQLAGLLGKYFPLQDALAADNLTLAQQAIIHLQTYIPTVKAKTLSGEPYKTWDEKHTKLIQTLQNMNKAENLETIREHFSILSNELFMLINTFGPDGLGTIYHLHCPMVSEGKGASWMQENEEVRNPYFGADMLECASQVKLISGKETEDNKGEHQHE